MMGATLPAIARRYGRASTAGVSLASLYTANTLGAVLGCVLTGFWLLAVGDVWIATFSAVALNFVIGAAALWRARLRSCRRQCEPGSARQERRAAPPIGRAQCYLASALSGLSALGAQVVWTRLLTLLVRRDGVRVLDHPRGVPGRARPGRCDRHALVAARRRPGARPALCQLGLIADAVRRRLVARLRLALLRAVHAHPQQRAARARQLARTGRDLTVGGLVGHELPVRPCSCRRQRCRRRPRQRQALRHEHLGAITGALLTSYLTIPRFGTHCERAAARGLRGARDRGARARGASRAARARAPGSSVRWQVALALACGWLAASELPRLGRSFSRTAGTCGRSMRAITIRT